MALSAEQKLKKFVLKNLKNSAVTVILRMDYEGDFAYDVVTTDLFESNNDVCSFVDEMLSTKTLSVIRADIEEKREATK